jgi:tripartite-type tricarboxylate transporter receptor subunit TctC
MPTSIVKQLNETLATVLNSSELREKLSVEAIEPMVMTSDQFGAFIKADIARWTKIARDRNIELES